MAPLLVNFRVSGPGSPVAKYHWDFGDGSKADGPNPRHRYFAAGAFQAVVTCTWAPDPIEFPSRIAEAKSTVVVAVYETAAKLDLVPREVSFEGEVGGINPRNRQITLTNSGGSQLRWSADRGSQKWLSVVPTQGTLGPGQSVDLFASADISGLSARDYSADLRITGGKTENQTVRLLARLHLLAPAKLDVVPREITFEGEAGGLNPNNQRITLTNSGGSQLRWSAEPASQNWLSVAPTQGTLGPGQSADLFASANISGLSARDYSADLRITGGKTGSQTVMLSARLHLLTPAKLDLAPREVSFEAEAAGINPRNQRITLTNSGGTPLRWSADRPSQNWLSVAPTGGTLAPGQSVDVFASANISGLSVGNYIAGVRFIGGTKASQQVALSARLQVALAKVSNLDLAPREIKFSAVQGKTQRIPITVLNTGRATLSWRADPATEHWLQVTPNAGVLAPGSTTQIIASAEAPGPSSRDYQANIVFRDRAKNETVTLRTTFKVHGPSLAVFPQKLFFSGRLGQGAPLLQSVWLTNTGAQALSWTARPGRPGWLSLNPERGMLGSGEAVEIQASVVAEGLAADSYEGELGFTAEGNESPSSTVGATLRLSSTGTNKAWTVAAIITLTAAGVLIRRAYRRLLKHIRVHAFIEQSMERVASPNSIIALYPKISCYIDELNAFVVTETHLLGKPIETKDHGI